MLFVGCNHEMPTEQNKPVVPPQMEKIAVTVNGTTVYDTTRILSGTQTIFSLKSINGAAIKYWSTTFSDSSRIYSGAVFTKKFTLIAGVQSKNINMVITGVDSLGVSYSKTIGLSVYKDDELKFVSVQPSSVAGKMDIVLAASKSALDHLNGTSYYYQGTSTNWTDVILTDSAYINYWAGQTHIVGARAPWIGIVMQCPVGRVDMGVGRILNDGSKWWGSFASRYFKNGLISFIVKADATIDTVGSSPLASMPGQFGDTGENPVCRGSITSSGLTIYLNNPLGFLNKHPFVSKQNGQGQFLIHELQTQAPGYTNWGQFNIPNTELAITNARFNRRFGPEISNPGITTDPSNSECYNSELNCITFQYIQVLSGPSNQRMSFIVSLKNL